MDDADLAARLGLSHPELGNRAFRIIRAWRRGVGRHSLAMSGILIIALVLTFLASFLFVESFCSDYESGCATGIRASMSTIQVALLGGLVLTTVNGAVNVSIRLKVRRRRRAYLDDAARVPTEPAGARQTYEERVRALNDANGHEPQMRGYYLVTFVTFLLTCATTLVLIGTAYALFLNNGGLRFDGSANDRILAFTILGAFVAGVTSWRLARRAFRARAAARDLLEEAEAQIEKAANELRRHERGEASSPITFRSWAGAATAQASASAAWPKPK